MFFPGVGQRGRPVAPHHAVQLGLEALLLGGEVDHVEEQEAQEGRRSLRSHLHYIQEGDR